MDLQGSLNLICRECWNENQQDNCKKWDQVDWRKSCEDQWLQRASFIMQNYKKRPSSRRRSKKNTAAQRKLEICRRYRANMIELTREVGGSEKFNPEQQVEVVEVMDNRMDDSIQKVQEQDYVTAMDCEETTSTHTVGFVEKVLIGLGDYFICRQKHCSMVCLSTHWVHNKPNGNYRCPACGEQYRPWKEQPGYWRANKVFVYYDAGRAELAAGSSDGLADNDQVMIFPVIWPDEAVQEIIDRFKAILLDINNDVIALPPQDRLGYVMENLPDTPRPCFFQQYEFLPETKAHIDEINARQSTNKKAWQYDHIEKDGYMGIKTWARAKLGRALRACGIPPRLGARHVARRQGRRRQLGHPDLK
jgi:hypothetical protein